MAPALPLCASVTLQVNVCKMKALTNMRSATKEKTEGVAVPLELTLDSAVEYIQVRTSSLSLCLDCIPPVSGFLT